MGLLYRKHLSKDAFARVTLSFGKRTNDFIESLSERYRLLKGQAISHILEEFLNNREFQEEFKAYSRDFFKIDDPNLEYEFRDEQGVLSKTIHHTNFEIPKKVVEEINRMMFDFHFVDRNYFIRIIIHFFYDKNMGEPYRQKLEQLAARVRGLGYQVLSSGVIDGELYVRVKS